MKPIINSILNVSNESLNSINTEYINIYNFYHNNSYFHELSGKEHYRLLMFISTLFNNNLLFDIGTYRCQSSLAMSYNKSNKIKSFDIVQALPVNPICANISYHIGNVLNDAELFKTPFIFLDTAHDGIFENIFYKTIKEKGWSGILLLDDIHLNDEMKTFWQNIEEEKWDLTNKGHWSGTGLVWFK